MLNGRSNVRFWPKEVIENGRGQRQRDDRGERQTYVGAEKSGERAHDQRTERAHALIHEKNTDDPAEKRMRNLELDDQPAHRAESDLSRANERQKDRGKPER